MTEVEVYLPVTVVGELFAWAYMPSNDQNNRLRSLRIFLSVAPVLMPDIITGERYGLIYTDLQQRGGLIPTNDIWIAALALQHNYMLVTRDHHFSHVNGLQVEYW